MTANEAYPVHPPLLSHLPGVPPSHIHAGYLKREVGDEKASQPHGPPPPRQAQRHRPGDDNGKDKQRGTDHTRARQRRDRDGTAHQEQQNAHVSSYPAAPDTRCRPSPVHSASSWPAFRQWWRDGANTRPTAAQARARLEQYMPELVPAWQRLTAMIEGAGADADAGPALALWNPPPFLTGCSQAAVLDGGPALIRNYDWDCRLFDATVARTAHTGRRVLGMLDCLWGLLDGVNDAGLAVSLTFGGRPQVGEGFGIPLVIRYVLEVCATAAQAAEVLSRIPVHMSYNVTALDASGPASIQIRLGTP